MGGNFVIGVIVFAILVHRELHRHHQGLRPHRRGVGALHPRRHARQADGDRRRPLRRPDRREATRAQPPQGAGGREQLLRRDGRRRQVRARRRHRRPASSPSSTSSAASSSASRSRTCRFGEAAQTYTLLTVGDGLVTQIPALIVSTAAGMLVTKAGVDRLGRQGAVRPVRRAIPRRSACRSFLMATMALLPGIPILPFLRSPGWPAAPPSGSRAQAAQGRGASGHAAGPARRRPRR